MITTMHIFSTDQTSSQSIVKIQKSMFMVCLDQDYSGTNNVQSNHFKDEFRSSASFGQILHGGGSTENTGNRWFDKTLQVISN